jgi:hypothetical protein
MPLLALIIGTLAALLALPAHAQDFDGVLSSLDPLAAFLGQGALASALIVAALMWLRRLVPALAPEPSTPLSRLLNLAAALGLGLALGAAGIAPPVPAPGQPIGLVAQLLGGFFAASMAAFGRDFLVRGQAALSEAKAPSDAGFAEARLAIVLFAALAFAVAGWVLAGGGL